MSHYMPYPAYKDSGVEWIGPVPEHWEVKRLRHVAHFANSGVDKKSYDGQQSVKLCNYTDVYYNEFITDALPFMEATASDAEIAAFTLKQGDVLMTKDSEDPSDIGIPALVANDMPGVVCGYHLTVVRTGNKTLGGYLHRSIQSHPTKAHFLVESPGITRYGLSQDAIGDIAICLPPSSEQSTIAAALDRETARIDALIAKKTRFVELLKEKIVALASQPPDSGDLRWIRLSHVCEVISRPVLQQAGSSYIKLGLLNRGRGIFKREDTDTEDMGDSDFFWVEPGDLILSGQFAWEGAVALAHEEHAGCVVSHRFPVIRGRRDQALTEYLLAYFLTQHGDFVINDCSRGSAGRNRPLNMSLLLGWKIPVPPMPIQREVARLVHLERLIGASVTRSVDLLRERRSALITAAVTGQIDLREAA